jgi:hypothetical protein
MSFSRRVAPICAVGLLAFACGKSDSPTNPTTSGPIVNTYLADVSLPGGVTGTVQLKASSSLSTSLAPRDVPVVSRILAWIEPSVAAQGSSASGIFVMSDGQVIPLSGTFSGGTFNVSGAGFTIVASVATTSTSTTITGTVTIPGGGSVPLTTPAPIPVTSPAPSDPRGTYTGTYQIVTPGSLVNRRVSDNSVEQNCMFNVVITGTLSLRLFNVLGNGLTQSELTVNSTESGTGSTSNTCGAAAASSWGTNLALSGTFGFEGPPTTLLYGYVNRGPGGGSGQGTVTRVESFLGAVSGNTVVMKVSRSFQFLNSFTSTINGPINSVMGYPTVGVTVTLTK